MESAVAHRSPRQRPVLVDLVLFVALGAAIGLSAGVALAGVTLLLTAAPGVAA